MTGFAEEMGYGPCTREPYPITGDPRPGAAAAVNDPGRSPRRSAMPGIGMTVRGAIGGTLPSRGGRPRAYDFIATDCHSSIAVGADDLARLDRVERDPDGRADRVLDEPDGAVSEEGVDAARVPAPRRREGRVVPVIGLGRAREILPRITDTGSGIAKLVEAIELPEEVDGAVGSEPRKKTSCCPRRRTTSGP